MIAICAVSRNWVIGKDGNLPWTPQKEDFKHFKELTWGRNILVGRKTFSTLPPLKNRKVYVLTRNFEGCPVPGGKMNVYYTESGPKYSIESSHTHITNESQIPEDIIICGGRQIYYQFIPKCSELYLTEFDFKVEEEGEIVKFPYSNLDLGAFFNRRDPIKEIQNGRIWHYSR